MSDFTAGLFQRVAGRYDEAVPFFATFGRRLVEWAALAPGDQVLDLGAGAGAITIAASVAVGPAGSVVAGDLAPAMVARVERLRLPNVVARLLDARALDLPDQSFDSVLAGFVLHTLPDRVGALREVARVLRPGGAAVFSTPGPSDDGGWWRSYGEIFAGFAARVPVPEGMRGDPRSWEELAGEADLQVVAHTEVELSLPIAGPEAHWRWLLSHGNRWLYDALGESDRRAFKASVLTSLHDVHPAQGRR
ncbi:MAG: methyltransferase domain-containing protein, partial [Candidatus Dormiibacterota bacterium]